MMLGVGSRPQRSRYPIEIVQRERPTASGFTIVCRNETTMLLIDPPTSALGSGTVVLPAAAGDGDVFKVVASKSIVAITYTTPSGVGLVNPPGALGVGGRHEFVFNVAAGGWYCTLGSYGKVFSAPKIANLTWFNQGAVSAVDGPTALEVVAPAFGSATANGVLLLQPVPVAGPPYTVAMKYSLGGMEYGSGNAQIGICIFNSGNNHVANINLELEASGIAKSNTQWWTTPISGSVTSPLLTNVAQVPLAFRIDVTSTQANFFNGADGFSWRASGISGITLSSTIGTPTHFGLWFYTTNSWATYQIESLGYWV